MFTQVIFRSSAVALMSLLLSSYAHGLELMDALSDVYQNNLQMKATREKYLAEIEAYPKALGAFVLPSVQYSYQTPAPASFLGEQSGKSISVSKKINGGQEAMAVTVALLGQKIAKADFLKSEQEFLIDAIKAFNAVSAAAEGLKVADKFLATAQNGYDSIVAKLNVGEASKLNVAQAELQLLDARSQKITAESNVNTSKQHFFVIFGSYPTDVSPVVIADDLPKTFEEFREKAFARNMDLESLNYQVQKAKIGVASSAAEFLPSIEAQWQKPMGYDTARDFSGMTLIVTMPLLQQGAEYSGVRLAKKQARQLAYSNDYSRKNAEFAFLSIWEAYSVAKKDCELYADKIKFSELEYSSTKAQYDLGYNAFLDVITAERDLFKVKAEAIAARNKYVEAVFNLRSVIATATAKELGLQGKLFDPDKEFKNVKYKIVGF